MNRQDSLAHKTFYYRAASTNATVAKARTKTGMHSRTTSPISAVLQQIYILVEKLQ